MRGDTRCLDGRLFRHDPQYDDPDLETDIGQCPECDGDGCEDHRDTSAAPQPPVEGLRGALEPFIRAARIMEHRPEDYGDRRVSAFGGLADAHDLFPKDFARLLDALASPSLTAGENTKSDGGVEGHALVTSKVALNEDADLSARRAESAPQASSVPAGIKPGPSDPLPTAPAPDVREALAKIINPDADWDRPYRDSEHPATLRHEAEMESRRLAARRLADHILDSGVISVALSQQPVAVADQEAITPFSVVERTLVEFFSANDVQTEEDGGEWLAYLGIDEEEFSLTGLATAITSALLHPPASKG